ncbi:MAG: hypothetical protein KC503_42165 [Myxococcales bacterium]|nr:hypothetical protein [Myxococcales bacterium]
MRRRRALFIALMLASFAIAASCAGDNEDNNLPPSDAIGPAPLATGKADGTGVAGPSKSVDDTSTRAWLVKNQWEDRDTANARKAGVAWGADSGLNWDEKYRAWINSMKKIKRPDSNYGETFEVTTPWGDKVLASPRLDCADVWIFLRSTFAAWYQLPFYLEGWDHQARQRVYFGHMGIRTASGKWSTTPLFRDYYRDYSSMSAADLAAQGWPKDSRLRSRGTVSGDEQPILGEGARMGAYLDEIHLNKRAGHLIRWLLIYFGTSNLIGGRNTYNLEPKAVSVGDAMIYRRASDGSGHTMVVLRQGKNAAGKLWVEIVSGNVPPRHPAWESQAASKRRFTNNEGGGPTKNSKGEIYSHIGGGLKRFRVAKLSGGRWMNTFMKADKDNWINDTDYEAIGARPATFQEILGEVSPEETRDALLVMIEDARRHLRQYPASCAARIRREDAFAELYTLMQSRFGKSRLEVDKQYRKKEDYVFAKLDYEQSKTCCWNKSTAKMYQLIMAMVEARELAAAPGQCEAPPIFMARDGGYQIFSDYAAAQGQAGDWVPWSADESCPQAGVSDDTPDLPEWSDYCALDLHAGATASQPDAGGDGSSDGSGDGSSGDGSADGGSDGSAPSSPDAGAPDAA